MHTPGFRIRIGNQTSFASGNLLDPFKFALEQGFDAFEWFPDKKESGEGWEVNDIDDEMRFWIRQRAERHKITLTVHAPASLNYLDPAQPDLVEETLEFARGIRASLLNLHLQSEEGIERCLKGLEPWIRGTAKLGLQIALENTPMTPPGDFNAFFETLIARSDWPTGHVGMCFDLGHANLCARTRNDYLKFLDLLAAEVPIKHLHLHENHGEGDHHLCLFTGPSQSDESGIRGMIERLRAREFDGCAILEQWPDPPELLAGARDRLRALFPEPASGGQRESPDDTDKPSISNSEEPFLNALMEAHRNTRSWREKLQRIHAFLTDPDNPPDADALAYTAVYLEWIHTGLITCEEDSRHFRPHHHAQIAGEIHECIRKLMTQENALPIRRIYPSLPSFHPDFQCAEPLTRIRDIAHRNDLPKELKEEIKHTLQNKLHRCAGPEDLKTSEKLLGRISGSDADYPETFVDEFRRFHDELKEFFNAQSLDLRLERLAESFPDSRIVKSIRTFLRRKSTSEDPGGSRNIPALLKELTRLRATLSREADRRNDSESQECRMAEIALEDYAFALLSEWINQFESNSEAEHMTALTALSLTLENLELDLILPRECRAIRAENDALRDCTDQDNPEFPMRLAANMQRGQRLFETFTDHSLGHFTDKAERLARALEIPKEELILFVEATVRRHLIFQYSKLVTSLLGSIRNDADLPSWETLVSGKATGRVIRTRRLTDLPATLPEPTLALVEAADGEEIIPDGVRAVILRHDVPHLSHLGVRARQARIVFVACSETEEFDSLAEQVGRKVELEATPESLEARAVSSAATSDAPVAKRKLFELPKVSMEPGDRVLPLSGITSETAGPKADSLRRLEELAVSGKAEFHTPPAAVLPFGILNGLLSAGDKSSGAPGTDAASGKIRERIAALSLPESLVSEMRSVFGRNPRLVVRSSSNLEDLETFAAAGLYESVVNVSMRSLHDAVRRVWASLWSERAVAERRRLQIPESGAHMAVILQLMVEADLSFFMHTASPFSESSREGYVELAAGMGGSLASAAEAGRPYRAILDKPSGTGKIIAFASFSHALRPGRDGELTAKTLDYSRIPFSRDPDFRQRILDRLATLAGAVEKAFGRPQDIEGTIRNGEISLVQSRPQHEAP